MTFFSATLPETLKLPAAPAQEPVRSSPFCSKVQMASASRPAMLMWTFHLPVRVGASAADAGTAVVIRAETDSKAAKSCFMVTFFEV